jgi:hypothetical protein
VRGPGRRAGRRRSRRLKTSGGSGLARAPHIEPPYLIDCAPVEHDVVKRLMWSGLVAGLGLLASLATHRVAVLIWRRAFDEDPPE